MATCTCGSGSTPTWVPADAAGSFVVRVGFPVNVALSAVGVVALVTTLFVAKRLVPMVVAGVIAFQAASLAVLIGTRVGSVLGWAEPVWTAGADQTRAVEIGALVALLASVAVGFTARRTPAGAMVAASR